MSKASIVSGMGIAMNLITTLMKMVIEDGGKEEDIHRLVTPEGEVTLRKMAKIVVEDANPRTESIEGRIPVDGDRAYSIYHGLIWEGILRWVEWNGRWGSCWVIVPPDGKARFSNGERQKYFSELDTENLGVYGCPNYCAEKEPNDGYRSLEEFGRGRPENMCVEYDAKRGMFYCRAYED